MSPIQLKPDRHEVVETPLARYCRRVLGDPNIITYYHKIHDRLVIASWFNKSRGWIIEHVPCPAKVRAGDVPVWCVNMLRWQRSTKARDILNESRRRTIDKERDGMRKQQDAAEMHLGLRRFLKKRSSMMDAERTFWEAI